MEKSFLSEKGEAAVVTLLSLLMLAGMYGLGQSLLASRADAYEIPEIEELPQKTGFGMHFSNVSFGLSFRHWRDKLAIEVIGGFVPNFSSFGGRVLYQVHKGKVSRAYFGLDMGYTHFKEELYEDRVTDTISLAGLFGYEIALHKKLPVLYYLEIGQGYSFGKEKINGVESSKNEPVITFGVGAHYYFK